MTGTVCALLSECPVENCRMQVGWPRPWGHLTQAGARQSGMVRVLGEPQLQKDFYSKTTKAMNHLVCCPGACNAGARQDGVSPGAQAGDSLPSASPGAPHFPMSRPRCWGPGQHLAKEMREGTGVISPAPGPGSGPGPGRQKPIQFLPSATTEGQTRDFSQ